MADDELEALRQRIKAATGRDMSVAEIAANRERVGRMLAFAERIAAWEPKLDLIEPANVTSILGGGKS